MSFIQLVTCWNMALRGILTGLYETKFITKVGIFSGYVVFYTTHVYSKPWWSEGMLYCFLHLVFM